MVRFCASFVEKSRTGQTSGGALSVKHHLSLCTIAGIDGTLGTNSESPTEGATGTHEWRKRSWRSAFHEACMLGRKVQYVGYRRYRR